VDRVQHRVGTRALEVSGRKSKLLWMRSDSSARSKTAEMWMHPDTLASGPSGSSDQPRAAVDDRRAAVEDSAVAKGVTSTPRATSPSVRSDTHCSQGPEWRGGTRHEIGASVAMREATASWRRTRRAIGQDRRRD
jgi:hypothetical protein